MASGAELALDASCSPDPASLAEDFPVEKRVRKKKTVIMCTFGFIVYSGAERLQLPPLSSAVEEVAEEYMPDECADYSYDEYDSAAYDDLCFSNTKKGNQFCRLSSRNKPLQTGHRRDKVKVNAKKRLERRRENVAGNQRAEKSNIDARLSDRGIQRLGLELYQRRTAVYATSKKPPQGTSGTNSAYSKSRHSTSCLTKSKGDHPATIKYTLHKDNIRHGAGDAVLHLIDIQHRELTPEDYELLLRLDDDIAPKTVPTSILRSIQVVTVDVAAVVGELCSICMELYQASQKVKTLPCRHTFHADCIDCWLTSSSHNCPLDGLAVAS